MSWGANAARVMLLVSCQLAALVREQPQLLQLYRQPIQQLLLYGANRSEAGMLGGALDLVLH